jgi:diaminopimelate decarboxylase
VVKSYLAAKGRRAERLLLQKMLLQKVFLQNTAAKAVFHFTGGLKLMNGPWSIERNCEGNLEFGGCDLTALAKTYGTPLYVMNEDIVRNNAKKYSKSLGLHYPNSDVAYACKAFMCGWMCEIAMEEALFLDVVSGGELYAATKAGFPSERILFHGNNKSPQEIEMGISLDVGRFVIDSYYEIELLDYFAGRLNKNIDVLIRVSPGVEAHTHQYIETGTIDSKFGFPMTNKECFRALENVLSSKRLSFKGFHSHIGSQILRLDGPILAAKKMVGLISEARKAFGIETEELDLGGGLGISYTEYDNPPSIETYVGTITETVKASCEELGVPLPKLYLEPGRSIVGEAGLTLYTVGSIREIPGVKTYVCVDGGMTDNPRPALYQSVYTVVPAAFGSNGSLPLRPICLAGKCCESGDIIIRECNIPPVKSGDVLAVLSTGAYNYSMSSNYNGLPRPEVVAVSKGSSKTIVRRESYADLTSKDVTFAGETHRPVGKNAQLA